LGSQSRHGFTLAAGGGRVNSPLATVRPHTKRITARLIRHLTVTGASRQCCVLCIEPTALPCYFNRVKQRILVVDDEPDAVELLEFNLKQAGYDVNTAADGASALKLARALQPALIVLDIMLPEMDGFEVCKLLRRETATAGIPIIMLTAKAAELDRVLGLELGGDDYVTKPFSPRELVLRVKKLLERQRPPAPRAKDRFKFGDLVIDLPHHLVTWRGKAIELTATEFRLITLLAERVGRVQSRDQLLRDVWQYETTMDTRTVDTHMRRLREKLGPAAKHLDTVRGVGYRFVEE
jgi:two-component system phosphate regulon response regulator PhoB